MSVLVREIKDNLVTLINKTDNSYYQGEVNDDMKPHGFGRMFTPTYSYYGNWANGLQDGKGTHTFEKNKYTGEFKNGNYHGKGILCYHDELFKENLYFEGIFVNGKKNGAGRIYSLDKSVNIKSVWKNGINADIVRPYCTKHENGNIKLKCLYKNSNLIGPSSMYYDDGTIMYQGDYNDAIVGNGIYYLKGDGYNIELDGFFSQNHFSGTAKASISKNIKPIKDLHNVLNFTDKLQNYELKLIGDIRKYTKCHTILNFSGQLQMNNKKIFAGTIKSNHVHGDAYIWYESGELYFEGTCNMNKKTGIIYNKDKTKKSEGIFCDGEKLHGKGIVYAANNIKHYEGNFFKGICHLECIEYYDNSQIKYNGNWKMGKYDLEGRLYYPNGNIEYDGIYNNNLRQGQGISYYESGNIKYSGEWANDQQNGEGILYEDSESHNIIYSGNFADALPVFE